MSILEDPTMGYLAWFGALFLLGVLAWLVSVVVRKRIYVPVEAVCVRVLPSTGRASTSTRSSWLFEFEGERYVVPKKPKGGGDKSKRKVGDRGTVYVNPRNVERSLTPQIDGNFKLWSIFFLAETTVLLMAMLP